MKFNWSFKNIFYNVVGLLLIVLLSLTFLLLNTYGNVSFADAPTILTINKDTTFHIFDGESELENISLDKLDSIEEQKALLTNLDELYPGGFTIQLGRGFYSINLQEGYDNTNVEYGKTILISGTINNIFDIHEYNNESYKWYYKNQSSDWTLDQNETTRLYAFGINFDENLPSGDYKTKGSVKVRFNLGGRTYINEIESNEYSISIDQSSDYEVYVPDKFYTLYTIFNNGKNVKVKLKDINMSPNYSGNFYNSYGTWSVAKDEDGERELNYGDNKVKLLFTPKNPSLLPREFDTIICGVDKEISVIVNDVIAYDGEPYKLTYSEVKGLYPGDTPENLGIELFLVSSEDGHRLTDKEIKPDNAYVIGGSISQERYMVRFEPLDSYENEVFPKPAKLFLLRREIESPLLGGSLIIKKDSGFKLKSKIYTFDKEKTVPQELIKENCFLYQVTGLKFTEYIRDSITGNYEDLEVVSGPVHVTYINNDSVVKYMAYLDSTGWHTVDFLDGTCKFDATDLQAVALFRVYENTINWLSILMTVLLGVSIGIMIILLVKRFGGSKK